MDNQLSIPESHRWYDTRAGCCRHFKNSWFIQVIYPDAHKHLKTACNASSVEDVKTNTNG